MIFGCQTLFELRSKVAMAQANPREVPQFVVDFLAAAGDISGNVTVCVESGRVELVSGSR